MALEKRIKEIKQKIIAAFVISVMFVLVFTTLNLNPNYVDAVSNSTTPTANLNVVAGALDVETTSAMGFGAATLGTQATINNLDVNALDTIGDSNPWTVTATSSPFANETDGATSIPNTRFNIDSSALTILNDSGAACTQTNTGSAGTLDAARTIMNGSAAATGRCIVNNVKLNVTVLPSDTVETYNATMTITITDA